MTTELLEEKTVTEKTVEPTETEATEATGVTEQDIASELEELLRFKRKHVPKEGLTGCPACTTLVDVTANKCPHCSSYIAPNNALVRETLRRIAEIEAGLDSEHKHLAESQRLTQDRSFWGRIRGMFSSSPAEPEMPVTPLIEEDAPRFLDRVRESDQLIILARVGSWYHVKTRDSRTGWVYSTMIDDNK
jgi:hypothetical protein